MLAGAECMGCLHGVAGWLPAAAPPRSELGRRACSGRGAGGLPLLAARARWASCLRAVSDCWARKEAAGGAAAGTAGPAGATAGTSLGILLPTAVAGAAAGIEAAAGRDWALWRLLMPLAAAGVEAPGAAGMRQVGVPGAGEAAPEAEEGFTLR